MTSLETAALDLFAERQLRGHGQALVASSAMVAEGTDPDRLRGYVEAYNRFPRKERCFDFQLLVSTSMDSTGYRLSIRRR